jgi:hypothetical protein
VHGRPRLTAPRLAILLTTVVAGATAALFLFWHRPVDVALPADADDPACAAMADRLPTRLLGQQQTATSQASPAVATWGRPAIIWRCGVEPPGPTTQDCLTVDGIDWIVQPLDDGTGFVTYGRVPAVQVLVPKAYAPETFALPALAPAVSEVPQDEHRCS